MSNHYAYQTHKLYRGLVCDIVHSLREGEWECEKELMDAMHPIPSGVSDLCIHFAVTKFGALELIATSADDTVARWLLDAACTHIDISRNSIMSIGRLQNTFERFWDTYISKCTRIDMHHKRRGTHAPIMNSRVYFADQVIKSWLNNGCIDIVVQPGEIRIGNQAYHTNRSWRRNVRELMGQDV